MVGLGHAHIYTSRLPSTVYGVQIKTESDHASEIFYMVSYNQKIQNGEPSPATFPIYLSFVYHKRSRTQDNMKNWMKEFVHSNIQGRREIICFVFFCPQLI